MKINKKKLQKQQPDKKETYHHTTIITKLLLKGMYPKITILDCSGSELPPFSYGLSISI